MKPEAARVATVVQRLLDKRAREVIEMLESCGVQLGIIPLWPEIWREKDGVHVDRFMLTAEGCVRRDGHGPMIEEFVIQPDRVPDWIPFG
jgi:hypothetical protein